MIGGVLGGLFVLLLVLIIWLSGKLGPKCPSPIKGPLSTARIKPSPPNAAQCRPSLPTATLNARASEEDLAEIAKEAEGEISKLGLETVSLDLLRRKVNLLTSLEFMGTKSAQGAGAFKDPDVAKKICGEAALALATVNEKLAERGLKPVGLSIEGHSSYDAGTAKQTSLLRARSTKDAISLALGSVGEPTTLQAIGYGAARPLEGFDDGGNHEANRRVEFRIIMDDESGAEKEFLIADADFEEAGGKKNKQPLPGGDNAKSPQAPKKEHKEEAEIRAEMAVTDL